MMNSRGSEAWQSIVSSRQPVASVKSSFVTPVQLRLLTMAMLIVPALSCQRDNRKNGWREEVQQQTCGENYTFSVDGSPQGFCIPAIEASAPRDCWIFFFNYSRTQQALLKIESVQLNTTDDKHSGAGSQCFRNPGEVSFSGTKSSELYLWVNKSFSMNYSYLEQLLIIKKPAAISVRSAAFINATNICSLPTGDVDLVVESSVYVYASNASFHDIQPNDIQCNLTEYTLTLNGSSSAASINLTLLAAPACNSSWELLVDSVRSCKVDMMSAIPRKSVTVKYKFRGNKSGNYKFEHPEGFTLLAISSDTILATDSSISLTAYEEREKGDSKSYSTVIVTVSVTATAFAGLVIAMTTVLILRRRRQLAGRKQYASQEVIPNADLSTAPAPAEHEEILMADNNLYAIRHAS